MICPTCGNIVDDNSKFCGNCGNKFTNMQNSSEVNEMDAIASFLSEMEGTSAHTSQTMQSETIIEQTEAVHQDTQDRLFLDDDDEEDEISDETAINNFFNNLDSLEEDAPMDLKVGYVPEQTQARKIAPVFEEIPEEEIFEELPATEDIKETNNYDDIDDYSDIVMGDTKPVFEAPVEQSVQPAEPVAEENNIIQPVVEDTKVEEQAMQQNMETAVPFPVVEENNLPNQETEAFSNEPQFFIDERPDSEQTFSETNGIEEFNINPETDGNTPYLDSFLQRPNFNVGFDTPEVNDFYPNTPQQNSVPIQEIPVVQQVPIMQQPQVVQQIPVMQQSMQQPVQQPMNNIPPMTQQIQQPQSQPPVEKKKSNVGLIVILCIVGALLVGMITTAFIFKDKIIEIFDKDTSSNIETVIPDNNDDNNTDDDNGVGFIPPVDDETTEDGDNTNNDETTDNTDDNNADDNIETPVVTNKPDWEIKENSSLNNPLIVGDATNVNRYLDDTKKYESLLLKLSKIYRGEDSLNIAKNYEGNSTIRFEKPAEGIEYVVVEYEVYIPKETNTEATLANLPIQVRGLSTDGVIYNNNSYIISTWCIEDGGSTSSDKIVKCQEIFQMPIGCTDYYLVFGTQGQNPATYKGE